jgi:hypothetical protein
VRTMPKRIWKMIVLAVHVRFRLLMDGGFGFWVKLAVL